MAGLLGSAGIKGSDAGATPRAMSSRLTPDAMDNGAAEIRSWRLTDNGWSDIGRRHAIRRHAIRRHAIRRHAIRRDGRIETGRPLGPGPRRSTTAPARSSICSASPSATPRRRGRPETRFHLDPPDWGREDYHGRELFSRADFARLESLLAGNEISSRFKGSSTRLPARRLRSGACATIAHRAKPAKLT